MSSLNLQASWAKVARARDHTDRLEALEAAFLRREPNKVRFDDETEAPAILLRVVVEPVPIEFSMVAGDIVHNLRSALDYLAWELVLSEGQTPGRHTAFPIYVKKTDFDKRVRNPPKGRLSPLEGIDPASDKFALVEWFQPYRHVGMGPNETMLAVLAALSNRDKHRGLLAGSSWLHALDLDRILEMSGAPLSSYEVLATPDILENEAPLARLMPPDGVGLQGRVEVKGQLPFEITVSDGDSAVPVGSFDFMRSEVVRVLRAFEERVW